MISLKNEVHAALTALAATVVYGLPADFIELPLVSWRESLNRRHAQADGREYLAELNYSLEIYADSVDGAAALAAAAEANLSDLGFRREAALEQQEADNGICHVSLRYRALADAAGNIYQ